MTSQERLPELDVLRFAAALAVAVFHIFRWPPHDNWVTGAARFGYLGVEVFFIISGYVILMTAEHRNVLDFMKSRLSRLYPTFWICVLLTTSVLALAGHPPSAVTVLANLTMVPPLFHQPFVDLVYWTLVVEWQFYALVALLLAFRQMRRIELWLAVWVLLACLSYIPASSGALLLCKHILQRLSLDPFGPLFAAGCYLYLIRNRGMQPSRLLAVSVCLVLSITGMCTSDELKSFSPLDLWIVAAVIVTAYAAFLLLSLRAWRLPSWRAWSWLGGLTYPLYLIHAEIGHVLWRRLPGNQWLRCTAVLLLSLLGAAVLSRYSERRACRAMHRGLDTLELRLRRCFQVGAGRREAARVPPISK